MKVMEKPHSENRQWFIGLRFMLTLALSFSLTACNAIAPGSATAPSVPASTTASSKPKKLEACALLAKVEVEKILGQPVEAANPGRLTEGTETTAAASQCLYKTASAQTVELFARRSPVDDNTPEAIQRVRDTLKELTQKTPVEVAGLGDTAFWTASRQLHVFAQGHLYFYVAMMNFKDEVKAKTKAIELARQALSNL